MADAKSEKSTRWAFTAYEGDYSMLDALAEQRHQLIAEIGWQDEICPTTQKKHRQGYVRTVRQVRFGQLKAVMGGVHLEKAKNWEALIQYCSKVATRDPSGQLVAAKFQRPMYLHELLQAVAVHYVRYQEWQYEALGYLPVYSLDSQTDRQELLRILRRFSGSLVYENPAYAAVLSRADARDAWCNYFNIWCQLGAHAPTKAAEPQ